MPPRGTFTGRTASRVAAVAIAVLCGACSCRETSLDCVSDAGADDSGADGATKCASGSSNIVVSVIGLPFGMGLPLQDATVVEHSVGVLVLRLADSSTITVSYALPAVGMLPLDSRDVVQVQSWGDSGDGKSNWEPHIITLRTSVATGSVLIAAMWESFGGLPFLPELNLTFQPDACSYPGGCGPASTATLVATLPDGSPVVALSVLTEATAAGFRVGNGMSYTGTMRACEDGALTWLVGYVVPAP